MQQVQAGSVTGPGELVTPAQPDAGKLAAILAKLTPEQFQNFLAMSDDEQKAFVVSQKEQQATPKK